MGGESYIVTTQPPPYEVIFPADGCAVERFVTDPLPDGNLALQFAYYFDALPVGASRTCTYEIEFYPSTTPPLTLKWKATTWYVRDNIDPDPSNNTFNYTLNAAPRVPPTSVPAGTPMAWFLLGIGLVIFTVRHSRFRGV